MAVKHEKKNPGGLVIPGIGTIKQECMSFRLFRHIDSATTHVVIIKADGKGIIPVCRHLTIEGVEDAFEVPHLARHRICAQCARWIVEGKMVIVLGRLRWFEPDPKAKEIPVQIQMAGM